MGPTDILIHLLSFLAPAFVVAVLVSLAAKAVLPAGRAGWWLSFVSNFLAGAGVLLAGLWFFGRDGKMATYAALVLVVASVQWLVGRSWRG